MNRNSPYTVGMGEQAGILLFSQWNQFCDLRGQVLRQGDVDSIHDLRVASRRLRASLGLFEPFIADKGAKHISREFRRITRELGRLRNIDEAMLYFSALPEPLPALGSLLSASRGKEMKAVTDILKPFPRQELDRLLRESVSELSAIGHDDPALPVYLSETSIRRYQAVHDLLLPATMPENVETRHALRIAIKKWRYLLEALGQVCRHDYSASLEALKEYQALLGSLNDMVEFAALCDSPDLPPCESAAALAAIARDTAAYLEQFLEVAAARPPQYTFNL
jgi:CHAD domain-containing protein